MSIKTGDYVEIKTNHFTMIGEVIEVIEGYVRVFVFNKDGKKYSMKIFINTSKVKHITI